MDVQEALNTLKQGLSVVTSTAADDIVFEYEMPNVKLTYISCLFPSTATMSVTEFITMYQTNTFSLYASYRE